MPEVLEEILDGALAAVAGSKDLAIIAQIKADCYRRGLQYISKNPTADAGYIAHCLLYLEDRCHS